MSRHPNLRLRQPECISVNRAKGFNRANVNEFFDLLEQIVDENKLDGLHIYNVDESGFSTVQKKSSKVISEKGKHQVGALSSGERGINTTMVVCCNAAGRFIPPMIIFKRNRFDLRLAENKPPGSLVHVSESGYINSELFLKWFAHFISHVKPSKEEKVLLLLDGHTSHSRNLEVITMARDHGVIILQLPGHTTHRLQPLDVSVFKPMESYYESAIQKWMRSHPGLKVSQFEVAELLNEAYSSAACIKNAQKGFKATGIWEVDRTVFTENDFLPSENLNSAANQNDDEGTNDIDDPDILPGPKNSPPSTSAPEQSSLEPTVSSKLTPPPSISLSSETPTPPLRVSIGEIYPLPTPSPKLQKRYEKGAQKAMILTISPYKNKLEEFEAKKKQVVEDKET